MPRRIRLFVALLGLLLVAGLGLLGWLLIHRPAGQGVGRTPGDAGEVAFTPFAVEFSLVDVEGRRRTLADFSRPWKLVYFGYTYCPDVCPTELAKMARALSLLAKADQRARSVVEPVFVTIDPARDTPARIAEYLAGFGGDFVGLGGTPDEIAAAARSFGVHHARVPESGTEGDDYLMEHSSLIFLVGARGRVVDLFTSRETPAAIAARLRRDVMRAPQEGRHDGR